MKINFKKIFYAISLEKSIENAQNVEDIYT